MGSSRTPASAGAARLERMHRGLGVVHGLGKRPDRRAPPSACLPLRRHRARLSALCPARRKSQCCMPAADRDRLSFSQGQLLFFFGRRFLGFETAARARRVDGHRQRRAARKRLQHLLHIAGRLRLRIFGLAHFHAGQEVLEQRGKFQLGERAGARPRRRARRRASLPGRAPPERCGRG